MLSRVAQGYIRLFNGQILTRILARRNLELGSMSVSILLNVARLGFARTQDGIFSVYRVEVTQRKDIFLVDGFTNRYEKVVRGGS